jgi:hypothetical protein
MSNDQYRRANRQMMFVAGLYIAWLVAGVMLGLAIAERHTLRSTSYYVGLLYRICLFCSCVCPVEARVRPCLFVLRVVGNYDTKYFSLLCGIQRSNLAASKGDETY